MKDTVTVKIGGKDENQTFDAITAHYKALAQGATPQTASALPHANRITRKGDIITIRFAGKDEWKATHAIRDAIIENGPQVAENSSDKQAESAHSEGACSTGVEIADLPADVIPLLKEALER